MSKSSVIGDSCSGGRPGGQGLQRGPPLIERAAAQIDTAGGEQVEHHVRGGVLPRPARGPGPGRRRGVAAAGRSSAGRRPSTRAPHRTTVPGGMRGAAAATMSGNRAVRSVSADTLSVLQVSPAKRVPGSRRGDHRDPGRVGADAGE